MKFEETKTSEIVNTVYNKTSNLENKLAEVYKIAEKAFRNNWNHEGSQLALKQICEIIEE